MNLFVLYTLLPLVLCDVLTPIQVIGSEDLSGYPSINYEGINPTLYKSVIKYQCLVKEFDDAVLVIYGTKSWTFPSQDVNLTLSYPTEIIRNSREEPFDDYIITGFKVHLFVDATESRGFFNYGGIGQESISLTFTIANISTLAYHFWIYGVSKQMATFVDYANIHFVNNTMC